MKQSTITKALHSIGFDNQANRIALSLILHGTGYITSKHSNGDKIYYHNGKLLVRKYGSFSNEKGIKLYWNYHYFVTDSLADCADSEYCFERLNGYSKEVIPYLDHERVTYYPYSEEVTEVLLLFDYNLSLRRDRVVTDFGWYLDTLSL